MVEVTWYYNNLPSGLYKCEGTTCDDVSWVVEAICYRNLSSDLLSSRLEDSMWPKKMEASWKPVIPTQKLAE